MQNYCVRLEAKVSDSYYAQRAANSVDLDIKKKAVHEIKIKNEINTNWNIIYIVGPSGSGKTTLAQQFFSDFVSSCTLDENMAVIDQFNGTFDYNERIRYLSSIGLNTVINWIKPYKCLSNGERERAKVAIQLQDKKIMVDEFTSVLDRTVAKITAKNVGKFCRNNSRQIILISPHYDIIPWLNPDYIIDTKDSKMYKYEKKKIESISTLKNAADKNGVVSVSITT